jgi:hypothetical protein
MRIDSTHLFDQRCSGTLRQIYSDGHQGEPRAEYGPDSYYWKGNCLAIVITTADMTDADGADMDKLLNDHLFKPTGR